jgi:hypothetical protein
MASSAASAKEDEVTSSEEAKAFSENDNNAEVRGWSLLSCLYGRNCK